jgi:nucleotide-binding universal stress UspA family protein
MTTTEQARLQIKQDESPVVLPAYKSILIAADASDHSNRGIADAAELGKLWQSTITGIHVYAAKMHDFRFRQMEGGLPEQYQEEAELEKQRDIHDTLITKGLSVITDCYLDQVELTCQQQQLSFRRRALEGKNYRALVNEANNGYYDLLVMGALGLGAVAGSHIGTVCERVVRRSKIDSLIIKDPKRSLSDGPIVVAIDGSTRAYGGLLTGLSLARAWDLPLTAVSAFNPYFHYTAFNRIASVLSEEAGKIFRFKEQEKLHEDIIDTGLAKIYQSHLDVAKEIAKEQEIEITTTLLDGKPHEVIETYLREYTASLLIVGKLGIHADAELDIGGNAENLLRNVNCSIWLSQRQYQPRIDMIAATSISWTKQAEQRINNVPEFVRGMARLGVLRYAQDQGHTVITDSIVQEVTKNLCPVTMGRADPPHRNKKSAAGKTEQVNAVQKEPNKKKCPLGFDSDQGEEQSLRWNEAALQLLQRVPTGYMRHMTRKRVETFARKRGVAVVTTELMTEKYQQWSEGSSKQVMTMRWSAEALAKIERIPDFVRGMVIREVECCARQQAAMEITLELFGKAIDSWASNGWFHSKTDPEPYHRTPDE